MLNQKKWRLASLVLVAAIGLMVATAKAQVSVTVQNLFVNPDFTQYSGGTLNVNGTTYNSGTPFNFPYTTQTFGASDQTYGSYYRVFNDGSHATGVSNPNYGWLYTPIGSNPFRDNSRTSSQTMNATFNGTTITANFRNQYNVTANGQTNFGETITPLVTTALLQYLGGYVTAPSVVTRSGGRTYQYTGWTDGSGQAHAVLPNDNLTLSATANYRGLRLSDLANATTGGQRRLVHERQVAGFPATSTLYLVYEQQGYIYFTYSLDNGSTWQAEYLVGTGKNPSLAPDNGSCLVVYNDNVSSIKSRLFLSSSTLGGPGFDGSAKTVSSSNNYPTSNSHPVAVIVDNNYPVNPHALVAYEAINALTSNTFIMTAYSNYDSGQNTYVWQGYTGISASYTSGLTNDLNPALDIYEYGSGYAGIAKLVWNDNVTSTSPIKYADITYPASGGSGISVGTVLTFSPSGGLNGSFQKPSIITDGSNAGKYITWQGTDFTTGRGVVFYKYVPAWNDPSYPVTIFSDYNSNAAPSIVQKSDGSFYIFYHTTAGSIRQAYNSGSGWSLSTLSLSEGGQYPTAAPRTTDAKFAYIQPGSPYRIALSTGTTGGILQNAALVSGTSSVQNTQTRFSVGDGVGFLSLTFSGVSVQATGTSKAVSVAAIPDTLHIQAANVLGLLNSKSFAAASAGKLTATFSVHTKTLSSLSPAVSVWTELYDLTTNQTLAVSSPVSLGENDSAKVVTADLNVRTLALGGKSVAVRAKVGGLAVAASHKIYAANIIQETEPTSSTSSQSAIAQISSVPTSYSLKQNYPNPFNPTTAIAYTLPEAAKVSLKVYDLLGREVATLVNETKAAGSYEARFDASRLASGLYLYKLQAGSYTETKKMMLVK
jgi:hypothetical protein